MIICVIGPPSAGKTTFIKEHGDGFKTIISDEIFAREKNWDKTIKIIRDTILNTEDDIIVELEPYWIKDLIDYIVEIKPPKKPRRKLDYDEEILFYEWKKPKFLKNKIVLKDSNLKWELLNKRFSKDQKNPLWKWK